ncbi:MAG: hypothetical protein UBAL2_80490398 [Leptospirillum rubarum]|uniref:Uncharacterized protein n=1 Tax=Leptospirillum sp. Group II '5-way CG' TaxID=419541 RepID=B6AS60_9BACT|nr:MAG: hypothetical protein UBAL2_80490398 [Leptospirillum rubarum]EDZ38322.1 MAG: Hypothetical protein CGL2_11278029 [Leptospirillum sp. Group II '5-way CG']
MKEFSAQECEKIGVEYNKPGTFGDVQCPSCAQLLDFDEEEEPLFQNQQGPYPKIMRLLFECPSCKRRGHFPF